MNAQTRINELVDFLGSLTDVDQRRACLAQLDQLLRAQDRAPRERAPLLLTDVLGEAATVIPFPG